MKFGSVGLLGWTVVVVVLSVVAYSVNAQACTPSTCPDEPVLVIFEHANCTGEILSYYPMGREYGVCYNQSFPYFYAEIRQNEIALFQSTDCDLESPDTTFFGSVYPFGVCGNAPLPIGKRDSVGSSDHFSGTASSAFGGLHNFERDILEGPYQGRMFLRNVNQSFTSPQPTFAFNPSIPSLQSDSEDCYGLNNCTLPSGLEAPYIDTMYASSNCSLPDRSVMFPYMEPNTCYNDGNETYVKFGCYTGNVRVTTLYYDSSCSTAAVHQLQHLTCTPGIISTSSYCLPDISPISPPSPTPTSNANSLVMTTTLLALAVLALL